MLRFLRLFSIFLAAERRIAQLEDQLAQADSRNMDLNFKLSSVQADAKSALETQVEDARTVADWMAKQVGRQPIYGQAVPEAAQEPPTRTGRIQGRRAVREAEDAMWKEFALKANSDIQDQMQGFGSITIPPFTTTNG